MKEIGRRTRILNEDGIIIYTDHPSEEVGMKKADLQVNPRTEPEPLLPTDRQSGNKDKNKTPQRNRNSNTKPLFPLNTVKNKD